MNPVSGRNKLTAYADEGMTELRDDAGNLLATIVEKGGVNAVSGRTWVRARAEDGSMWRAQVLPGTYCTMIRDRTR